ncbi:MAG: hypothetical protein OXI16_14445 [Chloroflexota bacterium]|nr:hypothetical protein [Chloroflexota bacterium]
MLWAADLRIAAIATTLRYSISNWDTNIRDDFTRISGSRRSYDDHRDNRRPAAPARENAEFREAFRRKAPAA